MKKKILIFSGIAIIIVLTITSFSGCARIGTKLVENAIEKAAGGDADFDLEEGGVVVTDGKGGKTEIGENAKLPDGWPSDTPLYPDTELSMSTRAENADTDKNEFSVLGEITSGTIKDVYNWYKDKYASGWEIPTDQYTESEDGDFAVLNFKSDKYDVSVMVTQSDETATLTMAVKEQ
ncbi:MAG: hypothetical protein ACYCXK_06535 [Candidatus Humimicrobiaceae bacterium]